MRIKVLLVDDEKLERVLIKKGYPWEAHDFEIIGEAASGSEALEFMTHRKPDVVITDISMPHMDGLAFIEEIRKKNFLCHIVIVTGYREFDYARKALRLGVEDFLLKPVNMKDIDEVAERIKRKMSKEQDRVQEVAQLKESILADHDILMESFFQRLVENRISEEEAKRKFIAYNCEELSRECVCVNIRILEDKRKEETGETAGEKESSITHKEVLHFIKKQQIGQSVCFIHFMQNIIIYFMYADKPKIRLAVQQLRQKMGEAHIRCNIGISGENYGFKGIVKAYEESEKAIGMANLLRENGTAEYEEYEALMKKNPQELTIDWNDFIFAVVNGLQEKVETELKAYCAYVKAAGIYDKEYLQVMAFHMLMKAAGTLNKYGVEFASLPGEINIWEELRRLHQTEQMERLLRKSLQAIMEYHKRKTVKQGNKVVKEALEYIRHNLYDPSLSLKAVAAAIYSNESYLSRVFKKEVGQSLIEYISKKRIEESIRLLNTTDMRVYEIAEKVGFRDSHYFSICFKKQMGITVKDFKQGSGEK